MEKLRFRQIHLDFHTSPFIPEIGTAFDKSSWQETLKKAHVNSITCFSSCHHGLSYHPTKVGKMHPGLNFNLLRAQIDACHEIGINAPVYLTGGVNSYAAEQHPEWREMNSEGRYAGWVTSPLKPGFKKLCFNSPYLDYLCKMLDEAVCLFPDADGIFIDIVSQGQCCCPWCMRDMIAEGYNPECEDDRKRFARRTLMKYYKATTEAVRKYDLSMKIFHNSGNVTPGDREILPYFSHLELESLPTGGWGYDHYPMSAAYCRKLNMEFLGMTGKFHTTWGEFGGFKHPNALRYECAAMIAQGSKCSIGDQLHPCGKLDESTYDLIGEAYAEVEKAEPWCEKATSAANIALLSNLAFQSNDKPKGSRPGASEIGAARFLLEEHLPFDILDEEMSFNPYQILILADNFPITPPLKARLDAFLARGGKLVLSGSSMLKDGEDTPAFDLPFTYSGENPLFPDYIQAAPEFAPGKIKTPFVMYLPSKKIQVTGGTSLGKIFDPYFNRTYKHFSSHQHTPYKPTPSGFDAGVMTENILYFAHPIFELYTAYGNVCLRQFVANALRRFAGNTLQITTNLPSQGRVTLMKQEKERRYILHLLYANKVTRGSKLELFGGNGKSSSPVEIIEELTPACDVTVTLRLPGKIGKITLVPQETPVPFQKSGNKYTFTLDRFTCHQMVALEERRNE